jgi:hypothetical protein
MVPDSTRYLTDPNYMPFAGQIYGYSDYAHSWTNGDSLNASGDQTSSFKVNTDTLTQFLSYGLTDDLEINGAIHYDPNSDRRINFANGTQSTRDSSGFSDPTFGVQWRVLNEGPYPFDLDVFGNYTPNTFDAKNASATDDGTIARGGQWGTVGAALGYVTPQFSLRGVFDANIYGNSNTFDLTTGDALRTQGYTDYVVALNSQTRLNPLFSVNAGIQHTFASNQNVFNGTTDVTHLTEPGNTTDLHAALNYNLIPDQTVVSLNYAHFFYGDNQSIYANPASDSSTHNRSGDTLGVQVTYVLP